MHVCAGKGNCCSAKFVPFGDKPGLGSVCMVPIDLALYNNLQSRRVSNLASCRSIIRIPDLADMDLVQIPDKREGSNSIHRHS